MRGGLGDLRAEGEVLSDSGRASGVAWRPAVGEAGARRGGGLRRPAGDTIGSKGSRLMRVYARRAVLPQFGQRKDSARGRRNARVGVPLLPSLQGLRPADARGVGAAVGLRRVRGRRRSSRRGPLARLSGESPRVEVFPLRVSFFQALVGVVPTCSGSNSRAASSAS